MSIQVSNINSIGTGSFNFVELSGSEKPLPPVNSVVNINILEKVNNGYKVLIDGRLFFSNLPVNLNSNETLIARVINHFPFILSLDNIASIKGLDEALSVLLLKLQVSPTKQTEKVLRSFILNKKPVIKSRLEKLSDLIESQQLEFDSDQLDEIVMFLGSSESNYQSITASSLNLFKSRNADLTDCILDYIRELNCLMPSSELVKELNKLLVLNINDDQNIDPLSIKGYTNNLNRVFEFICNVQENLPAGKEGNVMKDLADTLLIYNFRKALTSGQGKLNSFIILKINNDFELLQYDLESINRTFSFNLKMNPQNLNRLNARGIFNDNRLSLDLMSEPEVNSFLNQNRADLEERLDQNVGCQYNLRIISRDDNITLTPRSGKLNATA